MNMYHADMINQHMGVADYIEKKIADITGITPQREGQISASETVGGVERSVQSSSYITEHLFYTHGETKRRVLERLLDRAKFSWRDGKKASYVTEGDAIRRILNIEPGKFAHENFGIFVLDKGHDHEAMSLLRQAAVAEIQAGNSDIRTVLSVLKTDNLAKMETSLEKIYTTKAEQAQAAEQAKGEQMQAIEQSKRQGEMAVLKFKEGSENKRNLEDNQTKVAIANLQFSVKTNDANRNGVLDTVEARLKERELELTTNRQDRELDLDARRLQLEDKWKSEEIEIKRKLAAKPKIPAKG